MRTRGTTFHFYVKPHVQTYRRQQEQFFVDQLSGVDRHTTVLPIERESELQLNNSGVTHFGGYRYTPTAFHQLTQLLAPGLARLLLDLSGETIRAKTERYDLIDGAAACRLFNSLLDLRFPLVRHLRLIRNEAEKRIEGTVGARHKYLENATLHKMVAESLAARQTSVRFYTAIVVGRRLALWFRDETPAFTLPVNGQSWACYAGYYFGNGEATGTSVRATPALFLPLGVCLGPYKRWGGRVTHTGKDFRRRINALQDKVLSQPLPIAEWEAGLRRLLATPLGFAGKQGVEQRRHLRACVVALSHLGVPNNIADEAVRTALELGSESAPELPLMDMLPLHASRTQFDLFTALLRAGRRLGLARRERIEQAAHELLLGNFTL